MLELIEKTLLTWKKVYFGTSKSPIQKLGCVTVPVQITSENRITNENSRQYANSVNTFISNYTNDENLEAVVDFDLYIIDKTCQFPKDVNYKVSKSLPISNKREYESIQLVNQMALESLVEAIDYEMTRN
jgi:hypothetical protein